MNLTLPVALPPNTNILAYSQLLGELSNETQVQDRAQRLAQSQFSLLAHIASHVPMPETCRAFIIEAIQEYWYHDPETAKKTLLTAIKDPSLLVQEQALHGLMVFYQKGDPEIQLLMEQLPKHSLFQ